LRDRETECLCRIQIDDEIEQRRLDNREVGWFLAVEHSPGIGTNLTVHSCEARAVADQSASIYELTPFVDGR